MCSGRLACSMIMVLMFPISLWIYITKLRHDMINDICFGCLWFLTIPLWARIWCPEHGEYEEQEHVRTEYTAPVWQPPQSTVQFESVRAQREPYRERAMRALPPVEVKSFTTSGDCAICKEEFKNGEMVQPFGVCVHEFHSSCVRPWLNIGKTTCPVCRKDLSIALTTTRVTCIDI